MSGDLHTHTNFSDGTTDIDELVCLAQKAKLSHLAISDHDTALCVNYAYKNPVIGALQLIPAVELTCYDTRRSRKVHMLCYCPSLTNKLTDFFDKMAQRRNEAMQKSIVDIKKPYPLFSHKKALSYAEKSGVVFKTHLISVLNETNDLSRENIDLYKELFGYPNGKALHRLQYESVEAVIDLIKDAGGVAVLAHPSVYNSMELAQQLALSGAIDGVEVYHPRNTQSDAKSLLKLANECKLIITGGSDFHGLSNAKSSLLGSFTTNEKNINKILTLAYTRGYHKM